MLWTLAVRYITKRPLQYSMTIIVATISISLTVAVTLISSSLKQGLINASMPFDMIVGAKGSPAQLIFNTIFLQDVPIGNVDESLYKKLQQDERAAQLIPFAFGDNYKGYKIVGSDQNLFTLRPGPNKPGIFVLKEGALFTENYQAVIGSDVAHTLGLQVGDSFKAAHGLFDNAFDDDDDHEDDAHSKPYVVVGVLEPMYRPYDMGIFTSIETVWQMHGSQRGDITALMVKPTDYVGLMQMYQELNSGKEAQAAFPGQVLGNVFSIMGKTEDILSLISYMVVVIGFLTITITLYWSVLNRKRDHATLRALGASKKTILSLIVIESVLIMLTAGSAGLGIGHGIAFGISCYMRKVSYVYSSVGFDVREVFVFVLYTFVGVAGSILPAVGAYKQDVAKNLTGL